MTQIGRASLYITMGIVVAGIDVESMAANQIVSAFFFFAFVPVADCLGQTAQALLTRKTTVENQRLFHHALRNSGIVIFTCDASVLTCMHNFTVSIGCLFLFT